MAQPMKITVKQEKFTLNLFAGMSQREAYVKAGYSSNMLANTIDRNASKLAKNNQILTRLNLLIEKAESDKIMDVKERKERLSEISRARLTDFQELGKDGAWVNIGPESPNTAAISEMASSTTYDENGNEQFSTITTKVKLHDPIKAIAELNKMEKIYSDGTTVNVDNRKVEIIVSTESAKKLTEAIVEGENT